MCGWEAPSLGRLASWPEGRGSSPPWGRDRKGNTKHFAPSDPKINLIGRRSGQPARGGHQAPLARNWSPTPEQIRRSEAPSDPAAGAHPRPSFCMARGINKKADSPIHSRVEMFFGDGQNRTRDATGRVARIFGLLAGEGRLVGAGWALAGRWRARAWQRGGVGAGSVTPAGRRQPGRPAANKLRPSFTVD